MTQSVKGVVLAGGMSRRLGQDKTALVLPGHHTAILNNAVNLLRSLKLETWVACAADQAERAQRCQCSFIPDEFPRQGALGGIYSALKFLEAPCLVIACDMPYLQDQNLEELLAARSHALEEAAAGLRPSLAITAFRHARTGRLEPLVAVYEVQALPWLEQAFQQGRYRLQDAIASEYRACIEYGPEQEQAFLNINTPEDLAQIRLVPYSRRPEG